MSAMPADVARLARRLWSAVLVSNTLWIGFVAGAAVGSRFVPRDPALAGGAMVLWYGLGGACAAAAAAALAIRTLAPRHVRTTAILALVVAATLASYIAYRANA